MELEVLLQTYGEYEQYFAANVMQLQQRRRERRDGKKLLPSQRVSLNVYYHL